MTREDIARVGIIVFIGFFSGLANFFNREELNKEEGISKLEVIKILFNSCATGSIIAFVAYGLLDGSEHSFLFKSSVAALASYLGIDKSVDLLEKFLNFRKR